MSENGSKKHTMFGKTKHFFPRTFVKVDNKKRFLFIGCSKLYAPIIFISSVVLKLYITCRVDHTNLFCSFDNKKKKDTVQGFFLVFILDAFWAAGASDSPAPWKRVKSRSLSVEIRAKTFVFLRGVKVFPLLSSFFP